MFPQPIDSDFWTACASVGTISKGKIVYSLSRVALDQCAAACTYMLEETNRPDLECDQWHYNSKKRKCTLRKRNAKTETIVHGQAGRENRREISGNKACAYDGFANVWEHIPEQSDDFWDVSARRMEQAVDDHLKAPLN